MPDYAHARSQNPSRRSTPLLGVGGGGSTAVDSDRHGRDGGRQTVMPALQRGPAVTSRQGTSRGPRGKLLVGPWTPESGSHQPGEGPRRPQGVLARLLSSPARGLMGQALLALAFAVVGGRWAATTVEV